MVSDTNMEVAVALTNEDIDERFEIDARGVIRWKRVSAKGLPRWCAAKAEEINRKAGEEVRFFTHTNGSQIVKLYGGTVTEARVRKVLQRQTARDEAQVRARGARKRATEAKVAEAAAAATPSPEDAQRAAARKRYIRTALGYVQQPTGAWHRSDGLVWVEANFQMAAALAAGEEFDAMEEGND